MMKKLFILTVVAVFGAVSCATTSKVTLDTNVEVNEEVTVHEDGARESRTYTVSSFPYKTSVNSRNFPIKISMTSNSNVYSQNTVMPKEKGFGVTLMNTFGWTYGGLGALYFILGAAIPDASMLMGMGGAFMGIGTLFFIPNWVRKGKVQQNYLTFDVTKDRSKFSIFAKEYVENNVNIWQQKGEYEKIADWQVRVNDETRKEKAQYFYSKAEDQYIRSVKYTQGVKNYSLSKYDPENETFVVKTNLGDMVVSVPITEAQKFSSNFDLTIKTPEYAVVNDKLALKSCSFKYGDKEYVYDNQEALAYRNTVINYNFAPIDVQVAKNTTAKAVQQNISYAKMEVGDSDVDLNIPQAKKENTNTFAVVIGNEAYQRETKVDYALNDATSFARYCRQTMGLPEKNIHFLGNATLNNMRAEVKWLTDVAASYNGKANIIFYYAGHGIPDEASGSSYLLPVDGYGYDVTTGYSLSSLYGQLTSSATASTTVFLDACFSGSQRNGEMMASARGVAIDAKAPEIPGNLVVLSAAQGVETAYPYAEKKHGLFTYYLLQKIQQSSGVVTLGDLSKYVETKVRQTSIVENGKSQTPTVVAGPAAKSNWSGRML